MVTTKVVGIKGTFDLKRTKSKVKLGDSEIVRNTFVDKAGRKFVKFDDKFFVR